MMDGSIPDKSYFRIGEVSKMIHVEPYVIRYWESEFKSIKPMRTKSDQRLYRKKDVEELMIVKQLLYEEEFTIKGAKRYLARTRGAADSETALKKLLEEIKKGLQQIRELVG
jgi:DNA-binding transcriptional MerR regulator